MVKIPSNSHEFPHKCSFAHENLHFKRSQRPGRGTVLGAAPAAASGAARQRRGPPGAIAGAAAEPGAAPGSAVAGGLVEDRSVAMMIDRLL